jgi:hypothetical protein
MLAMELVKKSRRSLFTYLVLKLDLKLGGTFTPLHAPPQRVQFDAERSHECSGGAGACTSQSRLTSHAKSSKRNLFSHSLQTHAGGERRGRRPACHRVANTEMTMPSTTDEYATFLHSALGCATGGQPLGACSAAAARGVAVNVAEMSPLPCSLGGVGDAGGHAGDTADVVASLLSSLFFLDLALRRAKLAFLFASSCTRVTKTTCCATNTCRAANCGQHLSQSGFYTRTIALV